MLTTRNLLILHISNIIVVNASTCLRMLAADPHGVLHIHNLQETLKKKGVDFPNACQILEICNPQRTKEVLTEDMDLNMALPCLRLFRGRQDKDRHDEAIRDAESASDSPALARVAQEVEEAMMEMIAEAK